MYPGSLIPAPSKFFVSFISFDWVMLSTCKRLLSYMYCCAEATCTIALERPPLNISQIILLGPYFEGSFVKLQRANNSFVISYRLSVHTYIRPSAWDNSAATGRIFMKFDIWTYLENLSRKIQVLFKSNKNNSYFVWKSKHILIRSHLILLRMGNMPEKML